VWKESILVPGVAFEPVDSTVRFCILPLRTLEAQVPHCEKDKPHGKALQTISLVICQLYQYPCQAWTGTTGIARASEMSK
jgi:hypothetical protein